MRVHICAVGRLRGGPEADLINDYLTRFDRTGRNLGLGSAQVIEVEVLFNPDAVDPARRDLGWPVRLHHFVR